MKKILEIQEPIITTFTHHAHLLTILGTEPNARGWVFSNYIQIYIDNHLRKNSWGDFYFPMPYEIKSLELCKWILTQKCHENLVDKRYSDIVDYIKDVLENDFFVHMMINHKYLANSSLDRTHDILVFGYDQAKQELHCADFASRAGKYIFFKCSFDEFREAYRDEDVKKGFTYLNHFIYSYKVNKECDYGYNVHNIIFWLKQYVNSEAPEYWEGYNYSGRVLVTWGMDYYEVLCRNLLTIGDEQIDLKFYYLLKDHKKMMLERLKFLENDSLCLKEYIEAYEEIYKDISIVVNMAVKHNVVNPKGITDRMIDRIKNIKATEYRVLRKLIEVLEGVGG